MVTESIPWSRSVSTGFRVGVGARDEPSELTGASHFLEHLLFKGTDTRSAVEISEAIEGIGGEMNAVTGQESTAYFTRVPTGHLALSLDVLGDVIQSPSFRQNEIEAERQVILEEIAMDEDTYDDLVFTALAAAMYPGHPLGREVAGTRESIATMTREQIASFHAQWYVPANIVVSAAGQVDHDEVVEAVTKRFGTLDGGARPVRTAPVGPTQPINVLRRRTEQVHIAIGVPGLSLYDEDRVASDVAEHILGGGTSSRLFQSIREERGLSYSVYATSSEWSDAGQLAVYAGTAPSRWEEVLGLLQAELDRFVADGPTDAEVALAKGFIEGGVLLSAESVGMTMSSLGRYLLQHDHVVTEEEWLERYRAVTIDDVRRVIERVLAGAPRTVAVVGPVTKKDVERKIAG